VPIEFERGEERLEASAMIAGDASERFESRTCRRPQLRLRSRLLDMLTLTLEPPQQEVEAAAPLPERGARFREQPRQRADEREVDVAACAAPRRCTDLEGPVAARARQEIVESVRRRHVQRWYEGFDRRRDDGRTPVQGSRYVKCGENKRATITRHPCRITVAIALARDRNSVLGSVFC
jgi:hypothetical protein